MRSLLLASTIALSGLSGLVDGAQAQSSQASSTQAGGAAVRPVAPRPTTKAALAPQAASDQMKARPEATAAAPLAAAPPKPRPLPPRSADPAILAALAGTPEDDPASRFYAQRGYVLAWSGADQAALLAQIADSDRHALNPAEFDPKLDEAKTAAERDVRLTRAAIAYASALAMGRVNPEQVEEIFTLRRNVTDVVGGLDLALKQGQFAAWLNGLPPTDKGYQGLSSAYLRYRAIAQKGGWPAFVPGADAIQPGSSDPRVAAVAARLLAEGDLSAPFEGKTYSGVLVEAMKTFQVRHGLLDDGVIGLDTQDELAATAEDRARQIATNLERRRWLARSVAAERIDVNTAASILVYWRDNQPVHGSRVVNGKSTTPTPSLEASFSTVLANPPWNVPAGIAAKEILPKGRAYLQRSNMYVVDGRVVQRPGPGSALGAVKFELQNPYAIYLHDTPSKSAFSKYQRHLSHGCVRVENAADFARMLLSTDPAALAEFDAAQAAKQTERVSLGREIPVRLLYWTAFMTGADRVAFRKDVYGLDSSLGQALGVGRLSFEPTDRTKSSDIGP